MKLCIRLWSNELHHHLYAGMIWTSHSGHAEWSTDSSEAHIFDDEDHPKKILENWKLGLKHGDKFYENVRYVIERAEVWKL